MTDLRTAAQAVIDNYELRHKFDMDVLIKDLRQALATPVEPVANFRDRLTRAEKRYNEELQDGDEVSIASTRAKYLAWKDAVELYTTPPSLDVQRFHLNENDLPPFLDKLIRPVEPVCNPHPDAPHGFNRNASHTEDRYVCDCESWEPPSLDALIAEIDGLSPKLYEISTHPWTEDAYPVDELKAILDKYRGQK